MSHLSKLTLSNQSPRQPITPLARKRIKLLGKLDQQIAAAQAETKDEEFLEDIKRWVRCEDTGDKELVTQQRPVRKWWWTDQSGSLSLTLRDGNKIIPLDDSNLSIQVGAIDKLPEVLQTLRSAISNGELDDQLEELISQSSMFGKNKPKKQSASSKTS